MYCAPIPVTVFNNIFINWQAEVGYSLLSMACSFVYLLLWETANNCRSVIWCAPAVCQRLNAVMIMLLTFVNLQWVTVEHHSIWFRAQKSLVQLPKQVEFPLGLSKLTCWMGELLQAHFVLTTLWFQNEKVKLLIDVTSPGKKNHRMRSFGVNWIKISYGTSKDSSGFFGSFQCTTIQVISDHWGQAGIELFFQPWLYKR